MKNLPQLGDLTTMKNTDFIIFEERTNKKMGKKQISKKTISKRKRSKKTKTNKKRKSSGFFGLFR